MNKHSTFLRFILVGTIGFLVDAGILLLLIGAIGPYWGRLISFVLAVFVTWVLNRNFTFQTKNASLSIVQEFQRYFSAMIVGGTANYITYSALIFFSESVANLPIMGVVVGSIIGLAINYSLSKNWIFKS